MQSETATRLYRFTFVLILTLALAAAFVFVIRSFLLDILLAAIFSGLTFPLFQRLVPAFGGRRAAVAALLVVIGILVVALPLAGVATMVASEAVGLSRTSVVWISETIGHPERVTSLLPKSLAQNTAVVTAIATATTRMNDVVGSLSGFLTRNLSALTNGAVRLLLDAFVMAFAVFYFLQKGPAIVERVMDRIPVGRREARLIVGRTLQITAATLKSIVIVGTAQGILIGVGFAIAGVGEPWFWGTVAAAASTVPGLGSGLVWGPAAVYLAASGHWLPAIGLALWGLAVVAFADNLLRLYIIGRGASIPSFLVFISTLGGLSAFGPPGVLIGPVLAGTFMGVLDLYSAVLRSSGLLKSHAGDPTHMED